MRKIFLTSVKVNKPAASFVLASKIGLPSVVPVGDSRFRYLSSSLRSSSLHVPKPNMIFSKAKFLFRSISWRISRFSKLFETPHCKSFVPP